jgi:2-dehydropantoate 2-reductase
LEADPTRPRILVLGTGALGCYVSARLFRANVSVTMAGTWPEALAAIGERGVFVTEGGTTWNARVPVAALRGPLPPADIVLVLVKAFQTERVASHAARALAEAGVAVSLQNGWGNREVLEEAAPGRVLAGITFAGVRVLEPGRVLGSAGRLLVESRQEHEAKVAALGQALTAAGIPVETTTTIDAHLWSKLAVNCAINPLTALRGIVNGALLQGDVLRESVRLVAREVGAVAAARGLVLPRDPATLALETAAATAENRSSMLQDLDRGAPTEIDALSGAVVREGRRLGVPTPLNERLWQDVLAATTAPRVPA